MNQIDAKNLEVAIALGSAVCDQLNVCCDRRGRVIFQIYQKLEELKSEKSAAPAPVVAPASGAIGHAVDGTGAGAASATSTSTFTGAAPVDHVAGAVGTAADDVG